MDVQAACGADRARCDRMLHTIEQLTVRLGVVPCHGDGDVASGERCRRASRSRIALAEHEVHDVRVRRLQLLCERVDRKKAVASRLATAACDRGFWMTWVSGARVSAGRSGIHAPVVVRSLIAPPSAET